MSKSNVKTEIKKAKRRSKCSRFIGLDCIGAVYVLLELKGWKMINILVK